MPFQRVFLQPEGDLDKSAGNDDLDLVVHGKAPLTGKPGPPNECHHPLHKSVLVLRIQRGKIGVGFPEHLVARVRVDMLEKAGKESYSVYLH